MKKFTIDDLEDLALGSAVLGSGGGGDPAYDLLMAKYELEKKGPVEVISVDELKADDLVVPVAFMGAPLVCVEYISSGREFVKIMAMLEKTVGKKPTVVMPAEIGGSNAFTPIRVASQLGLPLLDADTLGRAFPELQMTTCNLNNVSPSPAFMSDSLGNLTCVDAKDSLTLESIARAITVSMGSNAAIALYLMDGIKAQKSVVKGSFTRAITIGKTIHRAKNENKDPIAALLEAEDGVLIGRGKITDVDQTVVDGFLSGTLTVTGETETLEVQYQNEYLLAKANNKVLATTPDIIMLLEEHTATPITSEALRYGLKVDVIALPSPAVWQTEKGLELVGPRYFGYDIDYKRIKL